MATKQQPINKLKGFKDILPEDWVYWGFAISTIEDMVLSGGFERIETPILEKGELFEKSVGEETDIVGKEMYLFDTTKMGGASKEKNKEKGENLVAMRPEYTAGIVRAYIENGMQVWPKPISLYSYGKCFRHENPQSGRYREFMQFNGEIFGELDPAIDAGMIALLWDVFQKLKISDIELNINSIGCQECRPKTKKILVEYFKKKQGKLCEDCKKRLKKNPLRILDCKNEKCQGVISASPLMVDNICEECRNHLMAVLEYLDEMGVAYNLVPTLVRGMDYYSRTVFEFSLAGEKRQNALGGGGRYDYLIEQMGGESTPAIGFALGLDRITDHLKNNNVKIPKVKSKCNVFIIQLGEDAKKIALKKVKEFRKLGLSTGMAIGKDTIKAQLKAADKVNALFAVIIGQREAVTNCALIRDMRDGVQETVELDDLNVRVFNMVEERIKEEEEYSRKMKLK